MLSLQVVAQVPGKVSDTYVPFLNRVMNEQIVCVFLKADFLTSSNCGTYRNI